MTAVASKTRPHRRPTQAERSAATRARLLDATIDCLVELGWSGTSTTEVVRRAGVSRGAQVHHYASKEDLVLAAVDHLLQRRIDEYRSALAELPAEGRTPGTAFDMLRSLWRGRTFEAWLELAVAARTHPALRERLAGVERRFWDGALALHRQMFPETAADPAFARLGLRFTFCLADGLAFERLVGADEADLDEVAEAFKLISAPYFPSSRGATA